MVGTVSKGGQSLRRGSQDGQRGAGYALGRSGISGEIQQFVVSERPPPLCRPYTKSTMMTNVRKMVIAAPVVRLWLCFIPFPTSGGRQGNQLASLC